MADIEITEAKDTKTRTCQQCGADISNLHGRRKFCESCKPPRIDVPKRSSDKPTITPPQEKPTLKPSDVSALVSTANSLIPMMFTQITPGSAPYVYEVQPDGTVARDAKGLPKLTPVGQALLIDPAEELALTWALPKLVSVDLPPSVRKAIAPLGAMLGVGVLGLMGWLHTQRILGLRREIMRVNQPTQHQPITEDVQPNPETNSHAPSYHEAHA
jgi:hypothetical protein